jgi:hypothetical protein
MANAYPELPALQYQRTSVPMADVIAYLQSADLPAEVKRSTYIVFRNESANGQSGVNNNYAGMQADGAVLMPNGELKGGRWEASIEHYFVGTTTAIESGTGRQRVFLCFATWQDSVACLASRLAARGLYVGGRTHLITQMDVDSAATLARAYTREWVTGLATAEPSEAGAAHFLSMYSQAAQFFQPTAAPTPPTPPTSAPVASTEVASLRAALADIIALAQAALATLPEPTPAVPNPDDSADDLNAQILAGIRGDAA